MVVHQGSVLSPVLFIIVEEAVSRKFMEAKFAQSGIAIMQMISF